MSQARFAAALNTARILWGALTASTLLLAFVAVRARPPRLSHTMDSTVAYTLAGAGVLVAITSFVLPARGYAAGVRGRRPEILEPGADGRARFANPEMAMTLATALYFTPFILSMALSEAVTLLGFVVYFQAGPDVVAWPLFAAGTLLAAVRFPTRARVLGAFERAHGASFPASTGGPGS